MRLGVWDSTNANLVATLLTDGQTLLVLAGPRPPVRQRQRQQFDLRTFKRVGSISGMDLLGLSQDGRRLLVASAHGVRLFDASLLTPVARMPGQSAAFVAHNGPVFATASPDGTVHLPP